MNKIIKFVLLTFISLMSISCAKDGLVPNEDSHVDNVNKGEVLISISHSESFSQDYSSKVSSDMSREVPSLKNSSYILPSYKDGNNEIINKFYLEIFNSSNTRIFRDKYHGEENGEGIKLNVGEYSLLAMCGDSLSYGFERPYYEAKQKFEVHSFKDNGGQPDRVEVVAKLANVGFNIVYGDNLKQYYEDYYVILHRKNAVTKKNSSIKKNEAINKVESTLKECKIKFSKTEVRTAYMPAGEVYLEIFAKRKGETKYGYYKTEPKKYTANDVVKYNVDTNPINGDISLNIQIDTSVELIEEDFSIPESALPGRGLTYYKDGVKFEKLQEEIMMGSYFRPEEEHISINSTDGLKSLSLILQPADLFVDKIEKTALYPVLDLLRDAKFTSDGIDLMSCSEEVKQALNSVGIDWQFYTNHGYLDLAGLFAELSLLKSSVDISNTRSNILFNSNLKTESEVATLIIRGVDQNDKQTEARIDFLPCTMPVKLNIDENNMWTDAARGLSVSAVPHREEFAGFCLNEKSNLGLQFSEDGLLWSDVTRVGFSDGRILFEDIDNLTVGNEYYFRAIMNEDENLLSEPIKIRTEIPEYISNNDFRNFKEYNFVTTGSYWFSSEEYNIKWWRFTASGSSSDSDSRSENNWEVNSPVSLATRCKKGSPDYRSFPTVSITDNDELMIASIAVGYSATETKPGTMHVGELFLGKSNVPEDGDQNSAEYWNESYWKKTIDSVEFNARPKALKFKYKLDNFKDDPIYAEIKLYDDEGIIIGEGYNDTINQTVTEWTEAYIPINYTIMNKKATHLGISIRSSATGNSETRKITVQTKSGEHKIHAGNILYLSSVNLEY